MKISKLESPENSTLNSTSIRDQSILLNCLPCTTIQTDRLGCISFLSSNWHALTGNHIKDCLGTQFHRYVYPDDQSLLKDVFSVNAQLIECAYKLRLLCAKRQIKWVQFTSHRIHHQKLGSSIVGIISDISQHVGREASLLANHRTLSELLNDFQGMVFRCRNDAQWTMEYISAGALKLTGYRPRDIINNTRISYNNLIVEEHRETVSNTVQRAVREKSSYDLIYLINTASEGVKLVWERGKGIYSESNDLLGLEGFVTDMTVYQDHHSDNTTLTQTRYSQQCVSKAFFLDRLYHRYQRLLHSHDTNYAVIVIHIDNYRRYSEYLNVTDNNTSKVEILKRLTPLLKTTDTIFNDSIYDIQIILDECSSAKLAVNIANSFHDAFRQPIKLNDTDLILTLSIGIALSMDIIEYLQQSPLCIQQYAERSMMRVNEVGGNNTEIFQKQHPSNAT